MENQQKTNSKKTREAILAKINDPELKYVISDVFSYSEEYEILIDQESINNWM